MSVNYSDLTAGTPIVWTDTGGDYAMTLNNLANGTTQAGPKHTTSLVDGTKGMPELLRFDLLIQFNSAPTAGNQVTLYAGYSGSATAGTDNEANLGGTDASINADRLQQLNLIGSLVASNNLGASTNQQKTFFVKPLREYVVPVLDQQSGVALKASNAVSKITMTPLYRRTPIA